MERNKQKPKKKKKKAKKANGKNTHFSKSTNDAGVSETGQFAKCRQTRTD